MSVEQHAGKPGRTPEIGQLPVERWSRALCRAAEPALRTADLHGRLYALAGTLLETLGAETFREQRARSVGTELVRLDAAAPECLGVTLEMIGRDLAPMADQPDEGRCARVQGAVAAGFTAALHERTRREQRVLCDALSRAREVPGRVANPAATVGPAVEGGGWEQAAVGISVVDFKRGVSRTNPALARLRGRPDLGGWKTGVTGFEAFQDFVCPDDPEEVREVFRRLFVDGDHHGLGNFFNLEKKFVRPDGSVVWTHLMATLLRDERGEPEWLTMLFNDITDRHTLARQLRYQATHDPLTGLPNRELFDERLRREFDQRADGRLAVCVLDLDGFKVINDSFGYPVGDQLLAAIGARLEQLVPGPHRLLARTGGDEFMILLPRSAGEYEPIELADRILAALAEPMRIAGQELTVSASIGIVEREVSGGTPEEMKRDADITLYWAKSGGKNRWECYDAERNARELTRFMLSANMPAALERSEFFLEYQPIVQLSDERLIAVEALVRWDHPEFGMLAPNWFIDLAEETGMIVPLGNWVLRNACRQARVWLDRYGMRAPRVSVNLSASQARHPELVRDVVAALDEAGIPASKLQLELVEGTLIGRPSELEVLRGLRDMGVRLAVDDFGTGYSNWTYLRRLPVKVFKLAGELVTGLRAGGRGDSAVDMKIVEALIDIAHLRGCSVIAEGVESERERDELRELGCDAAQGWLYAKAAAPRHIDDLLARGGRLNPS